MIVPDSSSKNGVIYARVSTEEQRKSGYSIQSQIRLLQEKMKADSVQPACDPIIDAESGRAFQREGLKKVLELARLGSIDYLYVYDQDRLGRNVAETPYLMYRLKGESGVITRTIRKEFDFKQPIDFVLAVLESLPGAVESMQLGERTQRGKIEKFRNGKWIGPTPLGYTKNPEGELTIVQSLQPILLDIFHEYERTGSLKETTKKINDNYHQAIGRLSANQIRAIITNPVYRGYPRYGTMQISSPQLAMISAELFDKLQTSLRTKARRSSSTGTKKPRSILDDLALTYGISEVFRILDILSPFCPRDGTRMVGNGSKLLKLRGLRVPNFICPKCKFQRTIPTAADLERFQTASKALICPRCRTVGKFAARATLDGDVEYTCDCCGFSFRLLTHRPRKSNSITVKVRTRKHRSALNKIVFSKLKGKGEARLLGSKDGTSNDPAISKGSKNTTSHTLEKFLL